MNRFFADLHIHIGRDMYNQPVKITGARTLTLSNILVEASRNKGIDMVGVIDSHVPAVQAEIEELIADFGAKELTQGGIQYEKTTLILGSEIEVYDQYCQGPIHVLCFFPSLSKMKQFTHWLQDKMTNIHLSSQRYYGSGKDLQYKVKELEGLFIPAHVFTPFKSLYGKGVTRSLQEVLDPDLIDGIELGLSADTMMADQISELHNYTFLTNSDAHSLAKIGREYQQIAMENPSFRELNWALHRIDGRGFTANFGMNPLLGKYHNTVCSECLNPAQADNRCSSCGNRKWIKGVKERINELKDNNKQVARPPYVHQVPLEYLPTLGPKTLQRLLDAFGTEMDILHRATRKELEQVVSKKLANAILLMRKGKLPAVPGGGGKYGRISLP
ncbi:endonuclease Q family protein [Sediminibacillus albus]|uniref:endonuclease Q family protein n=1 Tax=Sediminibacillus albus TaxID=407036 RepID=UPI000B890507|nr:endonuclease Q family protein [Sediminibacillus albus]